MNRSKLASSNICHPHFCMSRSYDLKSSIISPNQDLYRSSSFFACSELLKNLSSIQSMSPFVRAEKSQNGASVRYFFISSSLWRKSLGDVNFTVTRRETDMFTCARSTMAVYPSITFSRSSFAILLPTPRSDILIPLSASLFTIFLAEILPFAMRRLRISLSRSSIIIHQTRNDNIDTKVQKLN